MMIKTGLTRQFPRIKVADIDSVNDLAARGGTAAVIFRTEVMFHELLVRRTKPEAHHIIPHFASKMWRGRFLNRWRKGRRSSLYL